MQRRIDSYVPALAFLALLAASSASWGDDPKLVAVLVARTNVPAFEPLKEPEKLFKVVHYLKGEEPRDAVTDFEQVKDQRICRRLTDDQPLRKSDIITPAEMGIGFGSGDGQRALALKISNKSVEDALVGKCVDVYATFKEDGKEPRTEMVWKDIRVLAMDWSKEGSPTATVAISPEEALKFSTIAKAAEVYLRIAAPEKDKPADK